MVQRWKSFSFQESKTFDSLIYHFVYHVAYCLIKAKDLGGLQVHPVKPNKLSCKSKIIFFPPETKSTTVS